MAVLQTSILLKYQLLFGFLQRQAPTVAHEVQRSYVGAARTYYETGFRRYSRTLGWIKVCLRGWSVTVIGSSIRQARTTDRLESIATAINDHGDTKVDLDRLVHAHIDGPGVTLAFMADDKSHVLHFPFIRSDSDSEYLTARKNPWKRFYVHCYWF
jgi:hypothetical protein